MRRFALLLGALLCAPASHAETVLCPEGQVSSLQPNQWTRVYEGPLEAVVVFSSKKGQPMPVSRITCKRMHGAVTIMMFKHCGINNGRNNYCQMPSGVNAKNDKNCVVVCD